MKHVKIRSAACGSNYFLFTLTVNVKLYLHIKYLSNCAFNVSWRLIFESYLNYLEWLIIGLAAKYVESGYNIVDVVFELYKHFIKQSPSFNIEKRRQASCKYSV